MRIYVGFPIDQSTKSPSEQFEEVAAPILSVFPRAVLFNPFTAYHNAHRAESWQYIDYVVSMNNAALDAADFACFVWNGQPSFGVPLEIRRCYDRNKKYAVWDKTGKPGLYLRWHCLQEDGKLVKSEEELVAWLRGLCPPHIQRLE